MAKRIAILGSTGSVGKNALRVIEALGEGYEIFALSAHSNVKLLSEQVRQYKPKYAAVTNVDFYGRLCEAVGDLDVEILAGPEQTLLSDDQI